MIRLAASLTLAALPAAAAALDLTPPGPATKTFAETIPLGSHRVATGPFDGTLPQVTAEGTVTRRVWSQPAEGVTTLQLLAPLRAQLEADGWTMVFMCATRACGGFDFRFEIDVAPAPGMFVDLADYRYLSARKGDAWATLVVSRSGELGYVQSTFVDPEAETPPVASVAIPDGPPAAAGAAPAPEADIARTLRETGHAVLSDLDFAIGGTALAQDGYASLAALADYLEANPETTIALVGHTDAEGSAEANMAISRRRADSARALLTDRYGIAGARLESWGAGFFAPLARNDTEEGRARNRRVEAVVTSTE